ncbi:hypothetical protein ACTVKN_23340, partial [Serratia marcescens]|uniref:hypothetical protein n=1 Tax=Serratia marcescens TaxID=615 RepID=UPI003FA787E4
CGAALVPSADTPSRSLCHGARLPAPVKAKRGIHQKEAGLADRWMKFITDGGINHANDHN